MGVMLNVTCIYGPADINLKHQNIIFYERVLSHLLPFMFNVDL